MKTVSINNFKAFLTEIKTEAEAQGWTTLRDITTLNIRELILKSPNDAIIGLKELSDASTYFNILINYATAYDALKTFWNQPGSIFNYPDNTSNTNYHAPVLNLHNNTMNVFIFVNVNRIISVVNGLSKYVSMYVGRYLRNGTMGQIPNNLFAGGSINSSSQVLPLSSSNISFFAREKTSANCCSVFKDELNENIYLSGVGSTHPFNLNVNSNLVDRSNNPILFPTILTTTGKNLGELDGIFYLSSIAGIAPENTLVKDGITYKIFIDGNTTSTSYAFYAVEI